jgi:hypothetical protein
MACGLSVIFFASIGPVNLTLRHVFSKVINDDEFGNLAKKWTYLKTTSLLRLYKALVIDFFRASTNSRSQWPRGLRHELSSLSPTLGSRVRNPFEDMCMRLLCVYVVLCVGSGLATGWSPAEGVLRTVYMIKKLKKRPRPTGAVEP